MQAALVTNKYHLARSLICKVKSKNDLTAKLANGKTLAHVLAETSKSDGSAELLTKVMDVLLFLTINTHNFLLLFFNPHASNDILATYWYTCNSGGMGRA